jgi:ribonuclease G
MTRRSRAIYRAVADRPMKGQGGLTLTLGDGAKGYLRQAKGIAPGTRMIVQVSGNAEPGKAAPVTPKPLFKSRYAIVTPGCAGAEHLPPDQGRGGARPPSGNRP